MFDTIIKKQCGCSCDKCCDCYYRELYPYNQNYLSGRIILENEYKRGLSNGILQGWREAEDMYKIRFKSMDEQEKIAKRNRKYI